MSWPRRSLAEGVLRDEHCEFIDHIVVVTERQVGLQPVLEHPQAELLEAPDLRLGARLVGHVFVGGAAPQGQRLDEAGAGGGRVIAEQEPSVRDEALEAGGVDLVRRHAQHVAGGLGRQDPVGLAPRPARLQHVAEPRDVEGDRLGPALGRLVSPQLIDDPVRGDDTVGVDEEEGENSQLAAGGDREPPAVLEDLDRAQDAELHRHPPPQRAAMLGRRPGGP